MSCYSVVGTDSFVCHVMRLLWLLSFVSSTYTNCRRSLCQCSTCICDHPEAHRLFLHAYSNRKVVFFGDSTSKNAASILGYQLANTDFPPKHLASRKPRFRKHDCMSDCELQPSELPTRNKAAVEPELFMGRPGPEWTLYSSLRGAPAEFFEGWDDAFTYVARTNTSISGLFCSTPVVLRHKIQRLFQLEYGPLPDIIVMNVGRWSTFPQNDVAYLNELLRQKQHAGRFDVPPYNESRVVSQTMEALTSMNYLLNLRKQTYRPFVAYRELTWLNETGESWIRPGYLDVITSLLRATRDEWAKTPPLHIKYVPFYALTTLPCCAYHDYSHPGYECNRFLSTWLASFILEHFTSRPLF